MTFAPGIEPMLKERRVAAEAVLDHIEPAMELIVGVANAEPVTVVEAIEAAGGNCGTCAPASDAAGARPALHRGRGTEPAPRLVVSVAARQGRLPRRALRARAEQLQRCSQADAPPPRPAARARGRFGAGSARLVLPRLPRRVRRLDDRRDPVLRRGQPPDAADLRREPAPRQRNKIARPAPSVRAGCTTSSPTTPASSSGPSTTPTIPGTSPARIASRPSTPRSRSTSSVSARRSRWAASTGHHLAASPTSPAAP
jgi:hypothetical protein